MHKIHLVDELFEVTELQSVTLKSGKKISEKAFELCRRNLNGLTNFSTSKKNIPHFQLQMSLMSAHQLSLQLQQKRRMDSKKSSNH